ncbi:MAG: hypothetical protein ACI87O_001708 [Planctomycetota bacterium]|jgi:hypothetical protein
MGAAFPCGALESKARAQVDELIQEPKEPFAGTLVLPMQWSLKSNRLERRFLGEVVGA